MRVLADRLAVEPGRIADRLAGPLAGQLGHPLGGGAGGEPARREQQYLAAAPGLAEQGRRDRGGLAGAGRSDEHGVGLAQPRAVGRTVDGQVTDRQRALPFLMREGVDDDGAARCFNRRAAIANSTASVSAALALPPGKRPSASIARWP